MKTFYGKLVRSQSDRSMRYENGNPYNFSVVRFASKEVRSQVLDWVWANTQKNLNPCRRSDLLAGDFPVRLYESLEEFVSHQYPDYSLDEEDE